MTHCNKFQHTFTSIKNQKIELNFAASAVSSDGGAMLLAEACLKLGLISGICDQLIDPRQVSKIKHDTLSMLRQRVYVKDKVIRECIKNQLKAMDEIENETKQLKMF